MSKTTYQEALNFIRYLSPVMLQQFLDFKSRFKELPRGVQTAIIDDLAALRKECDREAAERRVTEETA